MMTFGTTEMFWYSYLQKNELLEGCIFKTQKPQNARYATSENASSVSEAAYSVSGTALAAIHIPKKRQCYA